MTVLQSPCHGSRNTLRCAATDRSACHDWRSRRDVVAPVFEVIDPKPRNTLSAAACVWLLALVATADAAALEVQVRGLAPDFEQNVRAHLSIVDLAVTLEELEDAPQVQRDDAAGEDGQRVDDLEEDEIDEGALEAR